MNKYVARMLPRCTKLNPLQLPILQVDCTHIWGLFNKFLGPNFLNFLGRSLEDFFPKNVGRFLKVLWIMSLEEFEKILQRRF